MIYYHGFVVVDDAMMKRAREKCLVLGETSVNLQMMSIDRAAWDVLREVRTRHFCDAANVMPAPGMYRWCIAFASTDPRVTVYTQHIMPPEDKIAIVKAILKKPDDVKPLWRKSTF
ncbi:hypothetical protein CERSUDRAFT_74601 [Gelatoporia subvermispora B]|uniref:Uncharacterized protein n=1 Tax=Ceriporiopsis subvermispora (strain B) TaxID=914234 RepID=M2QUL1_CERS8|nr:hypothetical protein CERSUDRAFT_74601 [Gelatoporia subvermispora B]